MAGNECRPKRTSHARNQKKRELKNQNRLLEQHKASVEVTQPKQVKLLFPSVGTVCGTNKSHISGGHLGLLGRTTNGGWSREIRLAGTIFSSI